jgi:hypothetical protein
MANLTYLELIDAAEQACREQVAWHKAVSPHIAPEAFEGYEAGYIHGWRHALAHLKLHGALTVDLDA